MIEKRATLLLPFCLAVLLHLAGAVCVSRMAGSTGEPARPSPWENRLRVEILPAPPARPAPGRAAASDMAPAVAEPVAAPAPSQAPASPLDPDPPAVDPLAQVPPRTRAPPAPAEFHPPQHSPPPAAVDDVRTDTGTAAHAEEAPAVAVPADTQAWMIDGQIAPRYPLLSRLRGEEGCVVVRVALDAGGTPIDGAVESSSGHEALDRAALNAVRRATWAVRPGVRVADSATNALVRVPIEFRIEAGADADRGKGLGDAAP